MDTITTIQLMQRNPDTGREEPSGETISIYALGLIIGLSEQQYSDARNETAIETAKKLARMVEEGDLPLGSYV